MTKLPVSKLDQEAQARIVLTSLITQLEKKPIPCLDAEVIALFTAFKAYNLNDLQERYNKLTTDEYIAVTQKNKRQYDLFVDYALRAIENSKKEHYKISKSPK